MPVYTFRDGSLFIENTAVRDVVAAVGTPCYCYSENAIRAKFTAFKQAADVLGDATVCFAIKANADLAILKILAESGAGADVVSGNEILLALKAGFPANKIVFSGVGKTPEELHIAVRENIKMINLESEAEAILLNDISKSYGKKTPVAVRVNPDVDAETHAKITTGKKENKFGLSPEKALSLYAFLKTAEGLDPVGVDVHIGSQILSLAPFEKAFEKTAAFLDTLQKTGIPVRVLDLGGGLGVRYASNDVPLTPDAYIATVQKTLGRFDCSFIFEPGRYLVAEEGVLATRVVYIKETAEKTFAVVDAGMNTLIRPALYDAFHDIVPVVADTRLPRQTYDIVGPVCESSDTFGKNRILPLLAQGDTLVIDTAGAYGETMASYYNMKPFAAAVLIDGNRFRVIRRPLTLDEMLADQIS